MNPILSRTWRVAREWTGLGNFPGRFPGVSKGYRARDVAVFPWAHHVKQTTDVFVRALLGRWPSTSSAS